MAKKWLLIRKKRSWGSEASISATLLFKRFYKITLASIHKYKHHVICSLVKVGQNLIFKKLSKASDDAYNPRFRYLTYYAWKMRGHMNNRHLWQLKKSKSKKSKTWHNNLFLSGVPPLARKLKIMSVAITDFMDRQ